MSLPTSVPRADTLLEAMALTRPPSNLDRALEAVAWAGYRPQSVVLPVALAAGEARTIGPKAAACQLVAWGVAPLGAGLKRVINRPRPITASLPILGHRGRGPSFPSTHVANYVSVYGWAAWLLHRRAPMASAVLVLLIAAIGPSRVRAGDHWASDVLAGYVLGGAYLAILVTAARRVGVNATRPAADDQAETEAETEAEAEAARSPDDALDLGYG
jgi:membrane-associated phospholipid phosphatase